MAMDNTQKAARQLLDALADSRYNPNWFANMVLEGSLSNDMVLAHLWQSISGYLQAMAMLYEYNMLQSENAKYVGSRAYLIWQEILGKEYGAIVAPDYQEEGLIPFSAIDLTDIDEV